MVGVYEVGKWGRASKNQISDNKNTKTINIHIISDGITRLPILEGEISHIEIPRINSSLGLTIVGGADTPLRCVVVQEVFPEGVVGQDARLQPGDQIIEVNGADMTSASHVQVCDSLRKCHGVLSLGVYRERIDPYKNHAYRPDTGGIPPLMPSDLKDLMFITLPRERDRQLGIRVGGRQTEPGVFVMKILEGSVAAQDGRLHPHDRLLAINDIDIRYARLDLAMRLLHQSPMNVSLIVRPTVRRMSGHQELNGFSRSGRDRMSVRSGGSSSGGSDRNSLCSNLDHGRTPSCESLSDQSHGSSMMSSPGEHHMEDFPTATSTPPTASPLEPDEVEHSHQSLPTVSHCECKPPLPPGVKDRPSSHVGYWDSMSSPDRPSQLESLVMGLRGVQNVGESKPKLHQKSLTLNKTSNDNLGMRVGGGVSSNEGDTPIYIAYINPQGPVGKSKQVKKGDVLLSVNNSSLFGLTHSQAVALLKTTVELTKVTLSLLEGPDTSSGPSDFVPSWLYWQKLPKSLHISKTVVLYRPQGTSLGFSIVGGSDPSRGPEPIHVLFVVAMSPAAMDGKLRCGDRLLAVDGHSLESVPHAVAVALLKQAGERVHLDIVSWLGTEL